MLKRKDTEHDCCMHFTSSYSHSFGGVDDYCCCFCGKIVHKKYSMDRDPAHGVYADVRIKVYEDA